MRVALSGDSIAGMTTAAAAPDLSAAIAARQRVAAAVRAHLGVHNLSASAVARAVGLSQSAISRRTNGIQAFDIDELGLIAEHLGLTLAELIEMPAGPVVGAFGSKRQPKDYKFVVSDGVVHADFGRPAVRTRAAMGVSSTGIAILTPRRLSAADRSRES